MIRQRKKVLGHAEDYSKVEWARQHSDTKKKPKQATEEEQNLLKEMQSPASFQTATTDMQLYFLQLLSGLYRCSQIMNELEFFLLLFLFMNKPQ